MAQTLLALRFVLILASSVVVASKAVASDPEAVDVPRGFGVSPQQIQQALQAADEDNQCQIRAALTVARLLDRAPIGFFEVLGGTHVHPGVEIVLEQLGPEHFNSLEAAMTDEFPDYLKPSIAALANVWFAAQVADFDVQPFFAKDNWSKQTAANYVLLAAVLITSYYQKTNHRHYRDHYDPESIKNDLIDYLRLKQVTVKDFIRHSQLAQAEIIKEIRSDIELLVDVPYRNLMSDIFENWLADAPPLRYSDRLLRSRQELIINNLEFTGKPKNGHQHILEEHKVASICSMQSAVTAPPFAQIENSESMSRFMKAILGFFKKDELAGPELRLFFATAVAPLSFGAPRLRPADLKTVSRQAVRQRLKELLFGPQGEQAPMAIKPSSSFLQSLDGSLLGLAPRAAPLVQPNNLAQPASGGLTPFIDGTLPISHLVADRAYELNFKGCHTLFGAHAQATFTSEIVRQMIKSGDERSARAREWLQLVYEGRLKPAAGNSRILEGRIKATRWHLRANWNKQGQLQIEKFISPSHL